jgi:hypothetical protein
MIQRNVSPSVSGPVSRSTSVAQVRIPDGRDVGFRQIPALVRDGGSLRPALSHPPIVRVRSSGSDPINQLVGIGARRHTTHINMFAFCLGFLVPIKAARLDAGGLSLYLAYLLCAAVFISHYRSAAIDMVRRFSWPLGILVIFAGWAVLQGAGFVQPMIGLLKLSVAFATTVAFMVVLRRSEHSLYVGLLASTVTTVVYMFYQTVSGIFFGYNLPYTRFPSLGIGIAATQRYGLTRVTGFSEEPSFAATLLVGSTLLLITYFHRTNARTLMSIAAVVGGFGLAMSTSNNLFGTLIIIGSAWPLIRHRRIALVMTTYYMGALIIAPHVLNRDLTFYARFSAYDIYLHSDILRILIGHGLGSFPRFAKEMDVAFNGVSILSLNSVWGGFLFEGGALLAILAISWLAGIIRTSPWRDGLTLFALLLMLSNYNSPWWPLVCLALAQCLVNRREDPSWTPKSISLDTPQHSAVAATG